MANQEGVKIVITAEDRFTETMKKIDASTKLFGQTAKNTEKNIAALEREMIRLVSNGMDPADAKIKEMKANYDRLTQSMDGNNNSIKESNKKWTSLALVVQDLPWGFRGIQNNLPALFGSIASAAGPAYLAFSAIIAAITYFDQESSKAAESTNKLYESFNKLKTETLSLGSIFSAVRQGTLSASDATKIYNEKLGDLYGTAKNVYEAEALYVKKTEGYVKAQYFRAKADIEYEKAKEALAKKDVAYSEDQVGVLGKLATATASFFKAGAYSGVVGAYKTASIYAKDVASQQVELAGYVTDREEAEFQKRLALGERYMSQAYAIEKQYAIKSTTVKDETTKKGAKPKVKKEKEDLFDILKATKEFYDAKLNFAEGDEIAQRDILLREKQTFDELINSNQISWDDYFKNVSRIYKNLIDFQIKEDKRLFDNQEKFGKSQIDVLKSELGVKLKLNKDNLIGQQDAVRESMAKVAVSMASAFGTGAFPVLLQYYDELNAKLEAMDQNALRGAEAMKQVNSIISNMATDTFVIFAENLGKALAGENVDLFGSFASMMGSGLQEIGKALIAYGLAMDAFKKAFSNPFAAVAAGVALIAAGAYLKSSIAKTSGGGSGDGVQTFANGGIVSGPTMGLMGEYPGAKSNPEVIAPLDKLKDLIGGNGGGTFVLRGQDLLLSVNRAQKASNLKGQNINLA